MSTNFVSFGKLPSGDWSTADGAASLARKIKAFWGARGVKVTTRVELVSKDGECGGAVYSVRSSGIPIMVPAR